MIRDERIDLQFSVTLSLGSNLGDREAEIRDAVRQIDTLEGVRVVAASTLVESTAVTPDGVDLSAPPYLNAVIAVRTAMPPRALLNELQAIERRHGRVRDERWADRTLDIDIVAYGGLVRRENDLTLPHPRAHERGFVLRPWLQIDADATLPGCGRIDVLPAASDDDVRPYESEALL